MPLSTAHKLLLLGQRRGLTAYQRYINDLLALSPLALWDAGAGVYSDAGTTPAPDAGAVQQWNDLSGNGHHVSQATAGARPTYRAAVESLNGLPGVEFDGGDWLQRSVSGGLVANLNAYTIYCVFRTTSSAPGGHTLYAEGNSGTTVQTLFARVNGGQAGRLSHFHRDDGSTSASVTANNVGANNGAAHLMTLRRIAANSWSLRMDGTELATDNRQPTTTTVNRVSLGAIVRLTVTEHMVGHIATGMLAAADNYEAVEPIIAAHYGITLA